VAAGAGWLKEEQIASGKPRIRSDPQSPPGEETEAEPRSTFGQVFGVPEFRALWIAQVLSVAGDQLARVAITLLVFSQTGSALLASVAFAASVVPTFLGGLLLSGLADRWPRRQVMITCDLGRAVIVGVMALPWMPLGVRVGLLFLLTMVGAPFSSARAALYPDILSGDQYVLGTAVTLTTMQFAQVAGFAVGGAAVSLFGVRTSLLVDAATFIASALITRLWVRLRPAARFEPSQPGAPEESAGRSGGSLRAGLRLVFGSPALLTPMLFGWLSAFYNVPEGIAAPLSDSVGGGDVAVGLILAAGAFGASVGAVAFGRLVPPRQRLRWMGRLATLGCATLILFAFRPPLVETLLVLAVSGFFDCYQLAANAAFVTAVPRRRRSQAFGIAQGGMNLGQGIAMIIAGAAAEHYPPSNVIAVTGALGVVATLSVAALGRVSHR
jgi:predicted MFS family arabinose efflux permease